MKIDLQNTFEAKKIENEFQNREIHKEDGISAPYQHLNDELKVVKNKMRSYVFQGNQLQQHLRKLQKDFYDDMRIIDEKYKRYDGEVFPWRSQDSYTRNQYEYWNITTKHISFTAPEIDEVSIRKAGHDKEIKVLNNICQRIVVLDDLYFQAKLREEDIENELQLQYGQTYDV